MPEILARNLVISYNPILDGAKEIPASVPRAHFKYKLSVWNCTEDEGRPLGAGLQEQASNRLKLRW